MNTTTWLSAISLDHLMPLSLVDLVFNAPFTGRFGVFYLSAVVIPLSSFHRKLEWTQIVQYPCGQCKLNVKDGDQAVQCEGPCSSWFHCSCGLGLNLTSAQYKRLTTEEKWMCANCCGDYSLPAFNSVNAVDVFHFNFQQNMPTPKLTVGSFICGSCGLIFLEYFVLQLA